MRVTTIVTPARQRSWLAVCSEASMRYILSFLVVAAIVGGFFKFNRREAPVAAAPTAVASKASAASDPSQHNWPKRTLDRVAEVKREVATQQKSNEVP